MYGERLTGSDYHALLACRTVGEAAGYLKRETAYRGLLAEVREDLVHRGQLESLIRKRRRAVILRLARYAGTGGLFLRLIALRDETELLMRAIRAFPKPFVPPEPPVAALARFYTFDPALLAGVNGLPALLGALKCAPCRNALIPFRRAETEPPPLARCEAALLTSCYKKSLDLIDEGCGGTLRQQLRGQIIFEADLYNLAVIYRMKSFPGADAARVEGCLILLDESAIRADTRRALLNTGDSDALLSRLRGLPLLRGAAAGGNSIESLLDGARLANSRRLLRFSVHPAVAVFCYMTLLRLETENITAIIEGIRYGVPPGEIASLLVTGTEAVYTNRQ
jgi:V/A-type H+-transporting ATPase subunit C